MNGPQPFCALLQRQINSSLWLTSFANQAQLQSSVGIVCGSAVIFLRSIAFVIPFFSIVVWPSKKALIRNNRPCIKCGVSQFTITFLTEEELLIWFSVYVHTHFTRSG